MRLSHKKHYDLSLVHSLRSPALGEAGCHVVRILNQLCGEAQLVRGRGLQPTAM